MGNNNCCQARVEQDKFTTTLPELSVKARHTIKKKNFAIKQQNKAHQSLQCGEDIYIGQINSDRKPEGQGKLYKKDGSVYMGKFKNGRAQGQGLYVMSNGDSYQGQFSNNKAEGNGHYQSEDFSYKGEFKNNMFQGKGIEQGQNYNFQGNFSNGRRTNGTLKWSTEARQSSYTGEFNDQNLFDGRGVLTETNGVYQGQFKSGKKQGLGVFKNKINGTRYKGSYKNGVKQGRGTLYNYDNTISYDGQFSNGLPHGKGGIYLQEKRYQTIWDQGIDRNSIQ